MRPVPRQLRERGFLVFDRLRGCLECIVLPGSRVRAFRTAGMTNADDVRMMQG